MVEDELVLLPETKSPVLVELRLPFVIVLAVDGVTTMPANVSSSRPMSCPRYQDQTVSEGHFRLIPILLD